MLQSVHVQLFAYFIIVIAIVFSLNMVIQFLREKKLNNESIGVNYHLPDLLLLLSRIFYFSGWGFIISNTLALILQKFNSNGIFNFENWNNLTFGIIILFLGIGLKTGKKLMIKEKPSEL